MELLKSFFETEQTLEEAYVIERIQLQRLIDNDGKADSTAINLLAKLSQFFAHGNIPSKYYPANNSVGSYSKESDGETVEHLRALSDADRVKLAKHLLTCLDASDKKPEVPEGTVLSTQDWIHLVSNMRDNPR